MRQKYLVLRKALKYCKDWPENGEFKFSVWLPIIDKKLSIRDKPRIYNALAKKYSSKLDIIPLVCHYICKYY